MSIPTIHAGGNVAVNQHDADNRAKALKHAETATDSLNILLDVYNMSDKVNRQHVKGQILDIATRSDSNTVLTDVINQLAANSDETTDLAQLIKISENLPEDEDRKGAVTVINMEQAKLEAGNSSGDELQQKIMEYAKTGMEIGLDPYQEIQNIYRALVFLGTSSQGPMYLEYITRLGELVKQLPEKDHAIKNLYYTTAALYYTRKRDYQNALEADRGLLRELDAMAAHEKRHGRDTSDLDYFYYVSYRRMLRNFKGLTPEEIEDLFNKCEQLAKTNERVQEEFGSRGLTHSYYYVGTGQFDKAVPELRKALSYDDISKFRRMELTGLLAWALRHTGDKDAELEVLRDYTFMYAADQRERRDATYREIELRNNVNKMLLDEYREAEKQKTENRNMRKTAVTLVYVLAVILIFLCQAYFRLRQKVKLLESGNRKLRTNIEQIIDNGMPSGTLSLKTKKSKLKG